jgi:hypothetical protein
VYKQRSIYLCVRDVYWCIPVTYILTRVRCVIVDFLLLSFKLSLRCLFRPRHVNQGGVQKTTPQVTLYKSHTAEESLTRSRAGRYSQVLSEIEIEEF